MKKIKIIILVQVLFLVGALIFSTSSLYRGINASSANSILNAVGKEMMLPGATVMLKSLLEGQTLPDGVTPSIATSIEAYDDFQGGAATVAEIVAKVSLIPLVDKTGLGPDGAKITGVKYGTLEDGTAFVVAPQGFEGRPDLGELGSAFYVEGLGEVALLAKASSAGDSLERLYELTTEVGIPYIATPTLHPIEQSAVVNDAFLRSNLLTVAPTPTAEEPALLVAVSTKQDEEVFLSFVIKAGGNLQGTLLIRGANEAGDGHELRGYPLALNKIRPALEHLETIAPQGSSIRSNIGLVISSLSSLPSRVGLGPTEVLKSAENAAALANLAQATRDAQQYVEDRLELIESVSSVLAPEVVDKVAFEFVVGPALASGEYSVETLNANDRGVGDTILPTIIQVRNTPDVREFFIAVDGRAGVEIINISIPKGITPIEYKTKAVIKRDISGSYQLPFALSAIAKQQGNRDVADQYLKIALQRSEASNTPLATLWDPGNFIAEGVTGEEAATHRIDFPSLKEDARKPEEVRDFVKEAGTVTLSGPIRFLDLGSSQDLKRLKLLLTRIGRGDLALALDDLAGTGIYASKFRGRIEVTVADNPDALEYVSEIHGLPEGQPAVFETEIELSDDGKAPRGQKDAPAYIFRNLLGLKGLRITFHIDYPGDDSEAIKWLPTAGGMGTSNFSNAGFLFLASMLSGADLSVAETASEATDIENEILRGYTGGQEAVVTLINALGLNRGANAFYWLGGITDGGGNPLYHPNSALVSPLAVTGDDIEWLENNVVLVQPGVPYKKITHPDGRAEVVKDADRAASVINNMWERLARIIEKRAGRITVLDKKGAAAHQAKLKYFHLQVEGAREHDILKLNRGMIGYVESRDLLSLRYAELVVNGDEEEGLTTEETRKWLDEDFSIQDRIALASYGLDNKARQIVQQSLKPLAEAVERNEPLSQDVVAQLNEAVVENFKGWVTDGVSIYSDYAQNVTEVVTELNAGAAADSPQASAFFTGAGGHGAMAAVFGDKTKTIPALEAKGIKRFEPNEVMRIVAQEGGLLQGWMEAEVDQRGFEVDFGSLTHEQAAAKGYVVPQVPGMVVFDETDGTVAVSEEALKAETQGLVTALTAAKASSAGAFYEVGMSEIKRLDAQGQVVETYDFGLDIVQKLGGIARVALETEPKDIDAAKDQIASIITKLQAVPEAKDIGTTAPAAVPVTDTTEAVIVPMSATESIIVEMPIGTFVPVDSAQAIAEVANLPTKLAEQSADPRGIIMDLDALVLETTIDGETKFLPTGAAINMITMINTVNQMGKGKNHFAVFSHKYNETQIADILGAMAVPFDSLINKGTVQEAVQEVVKKGIAEDRIAVTLSFATAEAVLGKLSDAVKCVMVKAPTKTGEFVSYKSMLIQSLKHIEGILSADAIDQLRNDILAAPGVRHLTVKPETQDDAALSRIQAAIAA
ncbi:hypothetical protein ACFL0T_01765 [Candidatus Omnitrophota bacterium]